MSEQPSRQPRWLAQLTPMKLLIVLLTVYLLIQVQVIILLVLLAILFATVIEMPLRRLESRGMPRSLGILTIYAGILAGLIVLLLVFVPLVSREAQDFGRQAPVLVDQLAENWRASDNPLLSGSGYRLLTRLSFQLENPPAPPGGAAIDAIGRIALVGLGIVSMFVMGFYWLMEKTLIRRLLLSNLDEGTGDRIARIWEDVEGKVGGWLRGQLLLCLIIGGSAGIGYYLLDVRFWLLLAVLAGVMELIPILGPWIGGIPAVMVALLDSWEKAAIVAIFLILLQLAENAILVPRIMKGTIGLSPLTVFIAVLAGGAYMGVLGALLAIPFAAALQVILGDLIRERQRQMQLTTGVQSPSLDWRGIFGQFLTPEQIERATRNGPTSPAVDDEGRTARDRAMGTREPGRPPASEPGS
jgi:predicted PurR-regulated permease PerM